MPPPQLTIQDAEEAIRQRFQLEGFRGQLEYDPAKVIENERWWYIPFCWIGCAGFIVRKDDFYVNWLGSAFALEQCMWGHDHGVVCDMVDFTFLPGTDRAIAAKLLRSFKHRRPNARGVIPEEPVWYWEEDVQEAMTNQFPTFKQHWVWYAIPALMKEWEKNGLRFTCELSRKA